MVKNILIINGKQYIHYSTVNTREKLKKIIKRFNKTQYYYQKIWNPYQKQIYYKLYLRMRKR